MRTELVSAAFVSEPNRYALVQMAAHGTRLLHRPHARIPDTINDVFRFLAVPSKKAPTKNALRHLPARSDVA